MAYLELATNDYDLVREARRYTVYQHLDKLDESDALQVNLNTRIVTILTKGTVNVEARERDEIQAKEIQVKDAENAKFKEHEEMHQKTIKLVKMIVDVWEPPKDG